MNRLLLTLCALIMSLLYASAQQNGLSFLYNNTVFVYADRVNIRTQPSLAGEVIATLPTGFALPLVQRIDSAVTIEELSGYWLEVLYQEQKAFIFEPLTTSWAVKSQHDPDYLFVLGKADSQFVARIKVIHQGKQVDQLDFPNLNWFGHINQFANRGSMGVPLVTDMLYVHYGAHSCGQIGGNKVFAFDGKKLRFFADDTGIGDGGFFTISQMSLPADLKGEKGTIKFHEMDGEIIWTEDKALHTYETSDVKFQYNYLNAYRWDGQTLQTVVKNVSQGLSNYYRFAFVFADQVNLRAKPSLESRILHNVQEGTRLLYLDISRQDSIGSTKGNWVKVRYENQVAYVWGPLLSRQVCRSGYNPDYWFLLGHSEGALCLKVKYKEKIVQEVSLGNKYSCRPNLRMNGNMGVPLAKDVLELEFPRSLTYCPEGGRMFWVFDGKKLIKLGEEKRNEADDFDHQFFIFPSEIGGQKGAIVQIEMEGKAIYERSRYGTPLSLEPENIRIDKFRKRLFRWNGAELVPL